MTEEDAKFNTDVEFLKHYKLRVDVDPRAKNIVYDQIKRNFSHIDPSDTRLSPLLQKFLTKVFDN